MFVKSQQMGTSGLKSIVYANNLPYVPKCRRINYYGAPRNNRCIICDLTEYEFECPDFLCAGLAIGLGDILIVVQKVYMGVSASFLPPSCTVL